LIHFPERKFSRRDADWDYREVSMYTPTNWINDLYWSLPQDMRARRPEEVGSVILVHCNDEVPIGDEVVSYTRDSRNQVYGKVKCKITIVDIESGVIVAQQEYMDDREGGKDKIEISVDSIVENITSLPRR
jgi:hypothetical protein